MRSLVKRPILWIACSACLLLFASGALLHRWYCHATTRLEPLVFVSDINAVPCCAGSINAWAIDAPIRARCRRHYRYDELNACAKASEETVREIASRVANIHLYTESWDEAPTVIQEISLLLDNDTTAQERWSRECWFGQGSLRKGVQIVLGYCPASSQLWLRVMEQRGCDRTQEGR